MPQSSSQKNTNNIDTKVEIPSPQHIAIIMDGNGRWAKQRGKPRIEGHRKGAEAVRKTVEACIKENVRYLTLYAFSSENWNRPEGEITALMGLLRLYISKEVSELDKNNVRLQFVGDRSPLADDIIKMMLKAEKRTESNTRLNLIIALNYGGREEILRATKSLVIKALEGKITPDNISEHLFNAELYSANVPNPELIIRTSGEQRISNFLLWQCAYSEFIFLKENWPDFNGELLNKAIGEFKTRDRRFGGTK